MSKRNVVFIMVSILVGFWSGSSWNMVSISAQDTLEQRVDNLEKKVASLQTQVDRDGVIAVFEHNQFQSWVAGRFNTVLYSTMEYSITLDGDSVPLPQKPVGYFMLSPKQLVLDLWVDEKLVAKVDMSTVVKNGDVVIAWMGKAKPSDWDVPFSPDNWMVPAYYWDSKTGFAVGFLHIDGSSQSGVVIK